MGCSDHHVISLLKSFLASNDTAYLYDLPIANCTPLTSAGHNHSVRLDHPDPNYDLGKDIYAFSSPWIIVIGLVGNLLSLRVFTSHRQLRTLSVSFYLIALSISDSMVLVLIFLEWLYKGLPEWPGRVKYGLINRLGVCQVFLFFWYTFRFISVYLIVIFTMERYIAVCKPLHRRRICTKSFARRTLAFVHLAGAIVSVYKPLLSGVFPVKGLQVHGNHSQTDDLGDLGDLGVPSESVCSRNREYDRVNFIMDLGYGFCITAVPIGIITMFNFLIVVNLLKGDSSSNCLKVQKNRIRLELTIMLLAISSAFILLNLPYFVVWVQQFLQSIDPDDPLTAHSIRSSLYVTKTIFNLNYAINFFVYCLTGTYYRSVIVRMLTCSPQPTSYSRAPSSPTLRTDIREMTSLVKM